MLWPCGHSDVLELAWLPDRRARRRRAVEACRYGACLRCLGAGDASRDGLLREALVGAGGGAAPDERAGRSQNLVRAGGRAAVTAGSCAELAGGRAAVGDRGVLVARTGRAVVDAGGRVLLAADAHDLQVWLLPWARAQVGARLYLVLERPWGEVLDADGTLSPAQGGPPQALTDLLEGCRAMGSHPRLATGLAP